MVPNEGIRQRLLDRRRELLRRYRDELERAEEELASRPAEPAARAAETWDAEVASHLGDADVHKIMAVMEALTRLDHGTYGTCTICHRPIATARLTAMPEAATCIDCAASREALSAHGS